jgi:hypothetical protein
MMPGTTSRTIPTATIRPYRRVPTLHHSLQLSALKGSVLPLFVVSPAIAGTYVPGHAWTLACATGPLHTLIVHNSRIVEPHFLVSSTKYPCIRQ